MKTPSLDKRIGIERPEADNALDGAGSGSWVPVDEVWARIEDVLPRRGEQIADGINLATRLARVRIRYRSDVTPDMRFVMGNRIMQIVSGPAELGRREALEFMVEDYRPAGNGA